MSKLNLEDLKTLAIDMMRNIYPGAYFEVDISQDLAEIKLARVSYDENAGTGLMQTVAMHQKLYRPKNRNDIMECLFLISKFVTLDNSNDTFHMQRNCLHNEVYILPMLKAWYNGEEEITVFKETAVETAMNNELRPHYGGSFGYHRRSAPAPFM